MKRQEGGLENQRKHIRSEQLLSTFPWRPWIWETEKGSYATVNFFLLSLCFTLQLVSKSDEASDQNEI